MKEKKEVIKMEEKIILMEITEEEFNHLVKRREEEAHRLAREKYIEEFVALIRRAQNDGFVFANAKAERIKAAEAWPDAAGNWIKIHF